MGKENKTSIGGNSIELESDYNIPSSNENAEEEVEGKTPEKQSVETITPEARGEIETAHTLKIAKTMGYKTKEELGANAESREFLDPLKYITNAQEVTRTKGDTIVKLESKIDNLEDLIKEQNKHQGAIVKARVGRRLAELKEDKDKAITDGDVTAVAAVEKEMEDISKEVLPEKKEEKKTEDKELEAAENQIMTNWQKDNPWFDKDPELTTMAKTIAQKFADTVPLENILDVIDAKMQRFKGTAETAQKEAETKPARLTLVDDGDFSGEKTHTFNDLTYEQKKVYESFEKADPHFNGDNWLKELVEIGELG